MITRPQRLRELERQMREKYAGLDTEDPTAVGQAIDDLVLTDLPYSAIARITGRSPKFVKRACEKAIAKAKWGTFVRTRARSRWVR